MEAYCAETERIDEFVDEAWGMACEPASSYTATEGGNSFCGAVQTCDDGPDACALRPIGARVGGLPDACLVREEEEATAVEEGAAGPVGAPSAGGTAIDAEDFARPPSSTVTVTTNKGGPSSSGSSAGDASPDESTGSSNGPSQAEKSSSPTQEYCDVSFEDDVVHSAAIPIGVIIGGIWLFPVWKLSKLPNVDQRGSKVHAFFGLSAILAEGTLGVASIYAGQRCSAEGLNADEAQGLAPYVVFSGAFALFLGAVDIFLHYRAMWSEKAKSSDKRDLEDRVWEAAGARGNCCGLIVIFLLWSFALTIAITAMFESGGQWLLVEDDESSQDGDATDPDAQPEVDAAVYGIRLIAFMITVCCLCTLRLTCSTNACLTCCCETTWEELLWRSCCREMTLDDDQEGFTKHDRVRIQYLLVRMVGMDLSGFLVNILTGSFVAAVFALDEMYMLAKTVGRSCSN